ncbi:MAG: ATP-binding protein, partial [Bdellovibrionota bacterium]|nr:ATP-binding protein [Bdellovibrionota bacterium]
FHKETFKISSKDIWAKAILYVYYETKNIMKKDKVHLPSLSKNITRIKALFKANHFEYATGVIKIIESLLIEGDSKHSFKEMKFSLIKLWKFFALLFRFDLDHSVWDEENDEFFDSKRFLRNEYHTDYSLFQIFLLNIDDDKQIAYDIFKTTMKSLMGLDEKEVNDLFLPDKSFLDYYVELGKKLTDRFNSTSLQNFKSDFLIKRDFSIFQQLEDHLSNQKFSWINYHQSLDIYKLFRAYFNISKVREKFRRPDTLDVLSKNFEESKKYLKRTFQDLPEEQRATIDIAFEKLLGLPVKFSLSKFYNLVSDISQSLNKKIQLKISGDEGSLLPDDFNQLQDALIHILRNSMDHGIESPSERLERGKKEMGTIEISCEESKTGSLRIVVKDDGGGINLKKVEERAIRNNICTQKELDIMSQKEKIDLIFLPNFSTKDTVSEISGRGFGMDVVKSTLEKIGANLDVATQEEEGTTFVIDITPKKKI